MAFDELLSQRIALMLQRDRVLFTEKKMFGGVAFMVKSKMCVGVSKDELMVRFDPALHDDVVVRKGAREMDFTKRPMRGYVFVGPEGISSDAQLRSWLELALSFNPKARSSRPKRRTGHR